MAVLPTARLQETRSHALLRAFAGSCFLLERKQTANVEPDPIPELKRQLATALLESLRGMTATEARLAIGLDPARRSDLRHGRLGRFSLEQLIRLLDRAGRAVTVVVRREA